MSPRTLLRCFVAIAIAVGVAGGVAASSSADSEPRGFRVIVSPDNPVTAVDREVLRGAFLRKTTEWNDGKTMRPVDLSPRFDVRDRFARDVLRKTPAQLRSYWNQQIFSGKGVPPPVADSVSAVVAYVLANPGAIGYLPADADPGRAKVVEVR